MRCKTRYCNSTCQHDHWRRGHKQICKKIHRGGNAEQYHADKKYKEAVKVAVEKCAEDTKDQTCYICTEALHWKTKEGLVRGCACRGTAGFAHVSCLAEQAKILVAEAEENNLPEKHVWARWYKCSLCEQDYHGVVYCALGWACWKTYVGRPEGDWARRLAMTSLGGGLHAAKKPRRRCLWERPSCLWSGALDHQKKAYSSCRAILRTCIERLDGLNMPYRCGETYTLET